MLYGFIFAQDNHALFAFRLPLLARASHAVISYGLFTLTPLVEFTHIHYTVTYAADIRLFIV